MRSIEERVKAVIIKELKLPVGSDISNDALFYLDLSADDLDVLEIFMRIEEEFDVRISEEVQDRIRGVKALIRYLTATTT